LSSTIFASGTRICAVCTFMNHPGASVCEVCALPLTANPTPSMDEELAARFAQEERERLAAEDASLAARMEQLDLWNVVNRDPVGMALRFEDLQTPDPEEESSSSRSSETSLQLANLVFGKLQAAAPQIATAGLDFVLLAQAFLARREVLRLQNKNAYVTTGYLCLQPALDDGGRIGSSFREQLEYVSRRMRSSEGGPQGRGITIHSHPYSPTTYKLGVICAMVQGSSHSQYATNVDSISFLDAGTAILKRADQCLPIMCFPGDLVRSKASTAMIWDIQEQVQEILDNLLNDGMLFPITRIDPELVLGKKMMQVKKPPSPTHNATRKVGATTRPKHSWYRPRLPNCSNTPNLATVLESVQDENKQSATLVITEVINCDMDVLNDSGYTVQGKMSLLTEGCPASKVTLHVRGGEEYPLSNLHMVGGTMHTSCENRGSNEQSFETSIPDRVGSVCTDLARFSFVPSPLAVSRLVSKSCVFLRNVFVKEKRMRFSHEKDMAFSSLQNKKKR